MVEHGRRNRDLGKQARLKGQERKAREMEMECVDSALAGEGFFWRSLFMFAFWILDLARGLDGTGWAGLYK